MHLNFFFNQNFLSFCKYQNRIETEISSSTSIKKMLVSGGKHFPSRTGSFIPTHPVPKLHQLKKGNSDSGEKKKTHIQVFLRDAVAKLTYMSPCCYNVIALEVSENSWLTDFHSNKYSSHIILPPSKPSAW